MKPKNKDVTTAVDPICGMDVEESTALSAEKDGKTYYFCSPGCKEKFLAPDSGARSPESSVHPSISSGHRSPEEKSADPEPFDRAQGRHGTGDG